MTDNSIDDGGATGPVPADAREARVRELEAALSYIAAEARAGRHALCAHELQMRLENIARCLEALSLPPDPVS